MTSERPSVLLVSCRLAVGAALACCLVPRDANAQYYHQASGRSVNTLPWVEHLDQESNYRDALVFDNRTITRWEHTPDGGWNGSGAAKFFLEDGGEDNSFLGPWSLPTAAGQRLRRLNLRWLVFYGPTYHSVQTQGMKTVIVRRCNGDCSGAGGSGQRGQSIELGGNGQHRYIGACENVCCGKTPSTCLPDDWHEAGKAQFYIEAHLGQWISYELELNLDTATYKLFIDTADGSQKSANGTSPYQIKTINDTSNWWLEIASLMGYWEQRVGTNAQSYFIVDEIAINNAYIGPPSGFGQPGLDTTPPTGVSNLTPTSGQANVSLTPTLTASAASDPSGPISYRFELYQGVQCSGTPLQFRDYATSSTWNPTALTDGLVYAWRNRARDTLGLESAWGACTTFAVATAGPSGNTGLPASFDFEEGNASEWNRGCNTPSMTWSTETPHGGSRSARSTLTGAGHDDNYCEHVFGNYYSLPAPKADVEEVWAVGYVKWDPTSTGPDDEWKLMMLNIMDGTSSQRCEQVYIYLANDGQYRVDRSSFSPCGGAGQWFHLVQNQGTPVVHSVGQWDKLKLYARLNTPGQSDGVVRMWVNDALKLEYTNLPIRQVASHTIQKFLLSTYSNSAFSGNAVQWHDDMQISTTDPDGATSNTPPGTPGNVHRTDSH